jgi:hypothetical protein
MRHATAQPVTLQRLELCRDRLCQLMAAEPDGGALLVPVYQHLVDEIALRREADAAIATARTRVARTTERA